MCNQLKEQLNVRAKRPKAQSEEERVARIKEYQREYQRKRRQDDKLNQRHKDLCRIHNDYAKKAVAYCKAHGITFDEEDD